MATRDCLPEVHSSPDPYLPSDPALFPQAPLLRLGKILVKVDKVYGNVAVYPVCRRALLLAEIIGTKTLTNKLDLIERLGFEVVAINQSVKELASGRR